MERQLLSSVLLFMVLAILSPNYSMQTRLSAGRGRTLLQAPVQESIAPEISNDQYTVCPVDFAEVDLTILISNCKAPEYPAEACCEAFAEFACPYADLLNDLSNDCVASMFTYINLYFPPRLFFNKCVESKRLTPSTGLECPSSPSPSLAPL